MIFPMKRNPLNLIIAALLVLIVGLWLFVFQVRQSEVVVVTTFGKPTRDIPDPGAYLKWPWPIQRVHRLDQRVQNFEDKFTEGTTADSFNLISSVYVGWRITEPKAFFPRFAGSSEPIAEAEKILEARLASAKAAVIGKHPLADLLSTAGQGTNFVAIEQEILAAVKSELRSLNYGLDIEFLGIKKLSLPESVTQSVFERMTSERQVLVNKSQYEGEAEAQKIRSKADREAAEVLSAAESEATRIRAAGEAEAAKSLAVFEQNPELANFLFRLAALENSLKERSVLIFDQHTPPFDLFKGVSTNLLTK
jgi:membrane protease subunit HflC